MSENPYEPPGSATDIKPTQAGGRGDYVAELSGDDLVISKGAEFPSVCLKCGSKDASAAQEHLFQYNPPYVIPVIVLCTMPGIILMLLVRKSAKMVIPLCEVCDAKWRGAKVWIAAAVGILIASLFIPFALGEPQALLVGLLVGFGAFLGIFLGVVNPALLRARKIDDEKVTIIGVHADAARYVVSKAR